MSDEAPEIELSITRVPEGLAEFRQLIINSESTDVLIESRADPDKITFSLICGDVSDEELAFMFRVFADALDEAVAEG